ncbi:MAG: response regulator [Balneolaceae bacterium]
MRRILIAAYHPLVIKGINQALAEQLPGSEIVGQATTIQKFIKLLARHKPDAAVVDVAVTWKCGVDLLEEVERIHPKVVLHFISIHPLDHHVVNYLERQTQGSYHKSVNGSHMRLF